MPNLLLWFAAGAIVIAIVVINYPKFLYRSTMKHHTPLMQKRFVRHPDGQISSVSYYYVNENHKMMWKFNEWSEEIHAEIPDDVIVEPGAYDGDGFFIFRYNRNGSETEWANPEYKKYFLLQKDLARLRSEKQLHKTALENYDKFISEAKQVVDVKNLDMEYVKSLIEKRGLVEVEEVKKEGGA